MQRQTNELAKKRLFDQVMDVGNKLEAQEEKLKNASREDRKKINAKIAFLTKMQQQLQVDWDACHKEDFHEEEEE